MSLDSFCHKVRQFYVKKYKVRQVYVTKDDNYVTKYDSFTSQNTKYDRCMSLKMIIMSQNTIVLCDKTWWFYITKDNSFMSQNIMVLYHRIRQFISQNMVGFFNHKIRQFISQNATVVGTGAAVPAGAIILVVRLLRNVDGDNNSMVRLFTQQ